MDDSSGVQQKIDVAGIPSAEAFGTPSILARTHLWIPWSRVATRQAAAAIASRESYQAAVRPVADKRIASNSMADEHEAALSAICAASFAVEAASRALQDLVLPADLVSSWERKRVAEDESSTAMIKRLHQVLLHALIDQDLANDLYRRWSPIVELRNQALHFTEEFRPVAPHPTGTNTAIEMVNYSAESASEAASVLIDTLNALVNSGRPNMRKWAADLKPAVADLTSIAWR